MAAIGETSDERGRRVGPQDGTEPAPTLATTPPTRAEHRPASAPAELPEMFGRYKILKKIGKGGK